MHWLLVDLAFDALWILVFSLIQLKKASIGCRMGDTVLENRSFAALLMNFGQSISLPLYSFHKSMPCWVEFLSYINAADTIIGAVSCHKFIR